MESLQTLFDAQLLLDDWRLEYNHYRPHQSLNYMTPAEYHRRCSEPKYSAQPKSLSRRASDRSAGRNTQLADMSVDVVPFPPNA
jgi:hypothetical protein